MDIRGLEQWENETREYNREAGRLKMKAGVGLIDALENWYGAWKTKNTDRNRRQYMTWRLRLHLRHNGDPEFLEELNDMFDIGLYDEEVGRPLWNVPAEAKTSFHTGFNWRRDSGNALRGAKKVLKEEDEEDEEDDAL